MSNQTAFSMEHEDEQSAPTVLEQWLTVDEVAGWLKVNKRWVYEHTRSRSAPTAERLPYVKIGKYLRFEPAAIRKYVARHARPR